jgi:hypothetical protein
MWLKDYLSLSGRTVGESVWVLALRAATGTGEMLTIRKLCLTGMAI